MGEVGWLGNRGLWGLCRGQGGAFALNRAACPRGVIRRSEVRGGK
jgi:hypothetical protein